MAREAHSRPRTVLLSLLLIASDPGHLDPTSSENGTWNISASGQRRHVPSDFFGRPASDVSSSNCSSEPGVQCAESWSSARRGFGQPMQYNTVYFEDLILSGRLRPSDPNGPPERSPNAIRGRWNVLVRPVISPSNTSGLQPPLEAPAALGARRRRRRKADTDDAPQTSMLVLGLGPVSAGDLGSTSHSRILSGFCLQALRTMTLSKALDLA